MKRMVAPSVVMVLLMSFASTALASSVHVKKNPALTFADQGLVLNATGALAGLGNGDVTITLAATADPSTTCTNQGGNQAPGQNPAEVTVTGSESIPAAEIKNGTLAFAVSTEPPAQPTALEAGCPSATWTAEIVEMTFKTATLTVEQGGAVVFEQTYSL